MCGRRKRHKMPVSDVGSVDMHLTEASALQPRLNANSLQICRKLRLEPAMYGTRHAVRGFKHQRVALECTTSF